MNRTDVIKAVAESQSIPAAQVERVVNSFLETVALMLEDGQDVNLRMFGKFEPRARKAVVRRNPRTGIAHEVPAKTSVGFVPSPNLKDRLNPD